MAIEIISVYKQIQNLLSVDATLIAAYASLGIGSVAAYAEFVPAGTPVPYTVVSEYANNDVNANGGYRVFNMGMVQVVTITKNAGFLSIKSIADRIDDVLTQDNGGVVDSVNVGRFIRESQISMCQRDEDDYWFTLGGIYSAMNHGV